MAKKVPARAVPATAALLTENAAEGGGAAGVSDPLDPGPLAGLRELDGGWVEMLGDGASDEGD